MNYRRDRLELADGDFLDLDWSCIDGEVRPLIIITHGLEGNTRRSYVQGMARAFNQAGWNALAWNFRGCSGEPNRLFRFYHSGASDDLRAVVNHAIKNISPEAIGIVAVSLGANLAIKYLGEGDIPREICGGAMFSVPFDLASSAQAMGEGKNRWYMSRFLREMRQKVQSKAVQFPKLIDDHGYEAIQTFWDFDNRYTAPMHGFDSARDYYTKCSAIDFLKGIHVPTLAVNARDDSFLGLSCFPESEANVHPFLTLEIPAHGGHVGFWDRSIDGKIWSERRAVEFLTQAIRIHSHESGARRLHRE